MSEVESDQGKLRGEEPQDWLTGQRPSRGLHLRRKGIEWGGQSREWLWEWAYGGQQGWNVVRSQIKIRLRVRYRS